MVGERWIKTHPVRIAAGVFLFYVLFSACANWSLLLGENLMKYDIWDAEYPTQVLMTDALASGTVPLWNPLMRYGSPYYAVFGSPVWYPLTLFLALVFGYSPHILAASYVMHIVIAQFGMFLLAGKELAERRPEENGAFLSVSGLCAGIAAGLLYGGCGVFLSNAQHIMIIISAAWIPWLFYFVQKYIREKKVLHLLLAGLCGGLILTGGYPELFYQAFLFLIPYVWYVCRLWRTGKNTTVFLTSVKVFIQLCICTVLAGAVTLIPFLCHMGQLTRTNGLGQVPNTYPFSTMLSLIFPRMTQFIPGLEPSMVNVYFGLFPVLLFPALLVKKTRSKHIYAVLALIACLIVSKDSFLHSLLYRILPMMQNFRFPTLARVFVSFFVLLAAMPLMQEVFSGKIEENVLAFAKRMAAVILLFAVLAVLFGYYAELKDSSGLLAFSESAFVTASLMGIYAAVFSFIRTKQLAGWQQKAALIGAVSIELLTFSALEGPITVTCYKSTDYCSNAAVRAAVSQEYAKVNNRIREMNFAGHKRSTSGLNGQAIVFQKTFDEEGYISFLMNSIEEFKDTYRRSIMETNPVIYFTDNVVTAENTDYDQWKDEGNAAPEQIFLDNALWREELTGSLLQDGQNSHGHTDRLRPEILSRQELPIGMENGAAVLEGIFSAGLEKTENIRLYFTDSDAKRTEGNVIELLLVFWDNSGGIYSYQEEFLLREEEGSGRKYVDIYFPDVDVQYQKVEIGSSRQLPAAAELVNKERMTADPCVNVSYFGLNRIELTVNAPSAGVLTFLQSAHKGWSAYIDGEKEEIQTVNRCFMGLLMDEGEHTVVMKFRPKDFYAGAVVSIGYLLAVLAAGICTWLERVKGKKDKIQSA
jgi:hypothetical protein